MKGHRCWLYTARAAAREPVEQLLRRRSLVFNREYGIDTGPELNAARVDGKLLIHPWIPSSHDHAITMP
jgi:hypothetical protein